MLKKQLPVFFLILLLAGMFWSRALMSLTQGLWLIYALTMGWKQLTIKTPLLIWSLIPLLFWVFGAYQAPFAKANLDLALTLAMYPATVIIVQDTDNKIRENQWLKIWLFAALIGLAYPLTHYFLNSHLANEGYGAGKSLPTFMDTDHVRFSIFLCSALLFLCCFPFWNKKLRISMGIFLLFVILFLSVRTGWVILLSMGLLFPILRYLQIKKYAIKKMLFGLLLLFVAISISYALFPSMQQKIAYSIWDWNQFEPGKYQPNYSDGTRMAINYAAWKSIQSGASNIGWANIPTSLNQSFSKYFNGAKTEFGWPFNQWLFWWMGAGWWGMFLFSGWLFYPIWEGWKNKNMGLIIWTIAIAFSCLAETTINYQYGAFLHIFPLAMLWKYRASVIFDNS